MKNLLKIIVLILAATFIFSACGNGDYTSTSGDVTTAPNNTTSFSDNETTTYSAVSKTEKKTNKETRVEKTTEETAAETSDSISKHKRVKFTMENGSTFVVELYPEYAPKTVDNFLDLVSDGFYDGLTFHRVIDGFMAQGGDPEGTGMGGSKETIEGEFAINGHKENTLSHTRGVISMARAADYNSASSQFFICYDDATFLDGQYAAFGMVVEGMETVDSFLEIDRVVGSDRQLSSPVTPIIIEKAEVI